jgi:TIR domain
MASVDAADSHRPPTVFLSYASEDREAARLIKDALPAFGIEVWYDESDLGGGELWDQKIRRQIRECDYFMPLVSARTEARHEGYFRREWRLAVERTLDMADDHPFLLPIVIDATDQAGARVPEKFLTVQWLRVPGGQPTAALENLCRRIASGGAAEFQAARKEPSRAGGAAKAGAPVLSPGFPEFPREEPGQRVRFWAHVVGWAFRSAWLVYKRWPRWIRIIVSLWLCGLLLSRGCTPAARHRTDKTAEMPPAAVEKLKEISGAYQGSANKADIAKLGSQIAAEISGATAEKSAERKPLLAIPFTTPAGDAAAAKLADSVFALVYGRIAMTHHGQVGLMTKDAPPSEDLAAALERGRAARSTYVLWGAVESQAAESRAAATQSLTIKIASVEDESVVWSKSYPVPAADPKKIAAEVNANVPSLEDD